MIVTAASSVGLNIATRDSRNMSTRSLLTGRSVAIAAPNPSAHQSALWGHRLEHVTHRTCAAPTVALVLPEQRAATGSVTGPEGGGMAGARPSSEPDIRHR